MAKTATPAVVLTPEQRAAARALMQREAMIQRADRAADNVLDAADAVRGYVGASAAAGLVGVRCTGTFLKRLVFGAPKIRVPVAAVQADAELAAVLRRHGML